MPHLGAQASFKEPTMMGEGTSPRQWMPSTCTERANDLMCGGTSSITAREMPADEPKVKKTPPKRSSKKRPLLRTTPTVDAHAIRKRAPTLICIQITRTITLASLMVARREEVEETSARRCRLEAASVSMPPSGVPSTPAKATTSPKRKEELT